MEVLVALFIIIALAAVIGGFFYSAKRRKDLAAWAATNGLSFNPDNDSTMDARLPEFDCLQQGHSRYASNVMTGTWIEPGDTPLPGGRAEISVCAFDYHYTTGSGKNQQTHTLSAVVVESPVPLKPLLIRPEGFFDKVAEFFGADEIHFESAEFSRQFFVKSPDKRWAYDVISQQMMEFLLNVPRFHVQFGVTRIMVWRSNTLSPADFGFAVRLARGILSRLPDYLVQQQLGE